jgi:hypothetical protein
LTNGDLHAQLRTWLDSTMPGAFQHGSMKKHVSRPVGEFNETEALFCIEPLDQAVDSWPGWDRAFAGRVSDGLLRTLVLPIGI